MLSDDNHLKLFERGSFFVDQINARLGGRYFTCGRPLHVLVNSKTSFDRVALFYVEKNHATRKKSGGSGQFL